MKVFSILGSLALVLLGLVHGSSILIPIVIALFLWILIVAVGDVIRKVFKLPRTLALFLGLILVLLFFFFPINLAIYTLPEVVSESLKYQQQIDKYFISLMNFFSLSKEDIWTQVKNFISIPTLVSLFATTLTELTASLILVILYIFFLSFDYKYLPVKLKAMFPDLEKQKWIAHIMDRINQRIKTYLWVKTFLSFLGALISYIIFKSVGLKFAEFWGVMIFFLGYIPNIGAFLGVIFPALLCLVQFESLVPFLVVSLGCGVAHFFIGNVLEPKLLGDSMNLSAFVILVSLVLWSALWGVIGAFLSVPITMILLIIFSEFPATRSLAIALSAKGRI